MGRFKVLCAALLTVRAGHPEHVLGAVVVGVAGEHEEQVREPVDVTHRLRVDGLGLGERGDLALGSAR